MSLPEFIRDVPMGPPQDFPPDSVEFAKATSILLISEWSLTNTTLERWRRKVAEAEGARIHRRLGFSSFNAYLKALIGKDKRGAEDVKARAEKARPTGPNGRPRKGVASTPLPKGTHSDRLTARIARDRPDILKRMKAGEFKSVRAAAIEAGIVKVKTPGQWLTHWWGRASKAERARFRRSLAEEGNA